MSGTALARISTSRKGVGGRPTDYRPEYCEDVIEYMGQGYSLTAFAGSIGQARETMYLWQRAHREFMNACNRAKAARVQALEAKLMSARRGGEVAAAIFALKNAAPDDWREVRNVNHVHRVADTLTDAELYAIASGKASGEGASLDLDPSEYQNISEKANVG